MAKFNINEGDYPEDFRFLYVSKDGNNANAGTQAAPLREGNAAVLKAQADATYIAGKVVIVLGAGIWAETLSTTRNKNYTFIGDGECILDGGQSNAFLFIREEKLYNVRLINYTNKDLFQLSVTAPSTCYVKNVFSDTDIRIRASSFSAVVYRYATLENCVAKERLNFHSDDSSNRVTIGAINCTYKDAVFTGGAYNVSAWYNNICYGNMYCVSIAAFVNNMFYGNNSSNISNNIWAGNKVYDANNNLLSSDQIALGKAKYFEQDSLSASPKFVNQLIDDFTLLPDSPCLFRGKDKRHIGARGRGYSYNSTSTEFTKEGGALFSQSYVGGVLEDDIEIDVDSFFTLKLGHKTGWVLSAIIDLGSDVRISYARLLAQMGFDAFSGKLNKTIDFECQDYAAYVNNKKYYRGDTCQTGGVKYICKLDYPNNATFIEYPPASSPTYWDVIVPVETSFQLDFEMRYGFTLAQINAAGFKKILFNNPVTVDNAGKGNADDTFNIALAGNITARFIQLRIKLKDLT